MKTTLASPVNTTNAMGKKRKRPKGIHKGKKDEENILSKDIEDDNIRYMMDTKKNLKPREDLKSTFTLKNLRFKPQKYKGSFLPYHLRWIFNNNVKSNEIVLLNEIEGLENEINRLKALKLINRECRKLAGLPFGITTTFCQCCHLFERKKHDCSHKFCNDNCPRKKSEELMSNLLKNNKLKEAKENSFKEKTMKKIFNEVSSNNSINKIGEENQDINIENNQTDKIDSQNNNKIILDKNLNNENKNNINENDNNKKNNTPLKRRLIFGTVGRTDKERRSIFLVKSDLIIENSIPSINLGINSTKKRKKAKSEKKASKVKEKIKDDNASDNKDDNDLNNCTFSIENKVEENFEEKSDKKENQEKKEEKIEEKNENKSENISENKIESYSDKDIDEDDIIIINQTSPPDES